MEYDDTEILELVLESRKRVLESFEEDTLTEAIARDLEARGGFVLLDDRVLRVSVVVSNEEDGTKVVSVEDQRGVMEDTSDERFRSLVLDVEKEDRRWGER